jgi:hypothetical protein
VTVVTAPQTPKPEIVPPPLNGDPLGVGYIN